MNLQHVSHMPCPPARRATTRTASAVPRSAAVLASAGSAFGLLSWLAGRSLAATHSGSATFDELVGTAAALGAWALSGWVTVCVTMAVLAAVPGWLGHVAARAQRSITPAATRRLLHASLGLATVAASGAISTAHATPVLVAAPPAMTACTGGSSPPSPLPDVGRPAVSPPPAAEQDRPDKPRDTPEPVPVRPGDTLWDIVDEHIGPEATPSDVAREWPRWHAANRAVIGADPDLIHPGQRLVPPGHI
ncbi:hypothetical protein EF847_04450 [Actinobacteria bacterium YIM 96077]|uniref:LysM domain-containing protein n=1 Tax=Phytoactinopolyspora halophila TaxID=1981511 RepID=A0A329R205_9ACTN|nr:hypothetical protein [Phytoactinopolyspora halophila]AYY12072.1 hypothetical protein EF847_04450 [Actinobacteria bacterium YIM 96077]RAW18694.1 hypothetical protein DPM12_01060 [Phytoactinopolyspora halophila]